MAMFSSADSSCTASATTLIAASPITTSMRMRWSNVRRSMSASEPSIAATSTRLGCSTWRRENASSLLVSSAARRLARVAAPTSCSA